MKSPVSSAGVVTRFDVVFELQPLAHAVITYSEGDYMSASSSLYSDETLSAVVLNLETVESEERRWLAFTSGLNFDASGMPGLEGAVAEYDSAPDAWQVDQEAGLLVWKVCVGKHEDDFLIRVCMISGYSVGDDKPLFDRCVKSLQQMLVVLGVSGD